MTTETPPVDLIRYDILTQQALRSVVQKVLEEVKASGLPGEHHFFITFDTGAPGVRLSKRMREKYPEEMTIVIQHTYWNLEVTDTEFEIDLSFDEISERLRIPYASIKAFFDPSVKFGLQFDVTPSDIEAEEDPEANVETIDLPVKAAPREIESIVPKSKKSSKKASEKSEADDDAGADEANEATDTAEVVSLDSFRNKK